MQLTQLMQQTSTTTQCNNHHLTKHTHIPKRPCFLYPASFLEIRFFFFTREQPSTSQIFLGSLPKLSKLFSLQYRFNWFTSRMQYSKTPMADVFHINFCNMIQCALHCIALHCIVLWWWWARQRRIGAIW